MIRCRRVANPGAAGVYLESDTTHAVISRPLESESNLLAHAWGTRFDVISHRTKKHTPHVQSHPGGQCAFPPRLGLTIFLADRPGEELGCVCIPTSPSFPR